LRHLRDHEHRNEEHDHGHCAKTGLLSHRHPSDQELSRYGQNAALHRY
jgi:hypothetical protein